MHDTFLLNKISQLLSKLSSENNIKRIEFISLDVNHNSHINEKNLKDHLQLNNKDIVGNELEIQINRKDIEEQTAVIKSIQGEKFGL